MTNPTTSEQPSSPNAACAHCSLDYDFVLPDALIDAAHRREVVIFAGAGISTEVPTVFPVTVYERAVELLDLTDPGSFPDVIQEFENRFGRAALVQLVKAKFDYIDCYPLLRTHARKFHYELATMPYLEDIITTNWDTYFEDVCLATPFVIGQDSALYNVAGRKVIKMHGSINNLASIIASEEDYKNRLEELSHSAMGGRVRTLLSSKTVVFIGYSLRDWNFRRLYEALLQDMDPRFAPPAYIVSPFDVAEEDISKFRLNVLQTSGVRFLRDLKEANYGQCFIKDDNYRRVAMYEAGLNEARVVARSISHREYPSVIYCWAFQDGARDACSRIAVRGGSGEYSSRRYMVRVVEEYKELAENAITEERFWDHAYIVGYITVLYVMLDDFDDQWDTVGSMLDQASFYLMYGWDDSLRTEVDFREALEQSRRKAPRQRKIARRIVSGLPDGMTAAHEPFLPDVPSEMDYLRGDDIACG